MIEDGRAGPVMIAAGAAQPSAAADGRHLIGFWEFVAHRGSGLGQRPLLSLIVQPPKAEDA